MTVGELLSWGRERLSVTEQGDANTNAIDAEALLSHLTGRTTASLIADATRRVPGAQVQAFKALIKRRAHGEPVAYLTGQKEFWSLTLQVTPAVLIPRPETELLVEWAVEWLRAGGHTTANILEPGTGSGAIALALASELPRCKIVATDISRAALEVAKQNYRRHRRCPKLTHPQPQPPPKSPPPPYWAPVEFRLGDWFQTTPNQRFDLIISNPPYIPPQDQHLQQGDLRFEPKSALISPHNGLADLKKIITQAPLHLTPGGMLLLEHAYNQAPEVRQMLTQNNFTSITTRRDLTGNERATSGLAPG